MRRLLGPLLLAVAVAGVAGLAACGPRRAPPRARPAMPDVDFEAFVREQAPRSLARHRVPGLVIAVVRDGRIAFARGFGRANVAQRSALQPDAVLRADPLARSVATWGALRLVEEGRLDLDVPLSRYVPRVPRDSLEPLTLRRLLAAPPHPSDSLLPKAVAAAAGEPFGEYLRDAVLQPLGMSATAFELRRENRDRLATGYESDGQGHVRAVPAAAEADSLLLYTTVEDLARWVVAGLPGRRAEAMRNDVLGEAAVQLLLDPARRTAEGWWTLGFQLDTLPTGLEYLRQGGSNSGWTAWVATIPERGAGIVLLANHGAAWPVMAEIFCPWSETAGGGRPMTLCPPPVPEDASRR